MKTCAFWLCLLLTTTGLGEERLRKTAVLFLPEQIECKSETGESLVGEVRFRWDEVEQLHLSLWRNPKTGRNDAVFGAMQVFDEQGRELDKVIYATLPPLPDGEVIVTKGEVKRFGVYQLYSTVLFPRPGDYYAVASFSYGISGNRSVEFTTNKRWFKVVEPSSKKGSI